MGYLRLLLAMFVAQQHLYFHGFTGSISVFGFFLLSGFLVTKMLNEVYNDGVRGKGLFFLNRFLRIYPVYWVCLFIGIYCVRIAPFESYQIMRDMALPPEEWWQQYAIFGLLRLDGGPYLPRILQPAWSLNTELVYYIILGLGVARSRPMCWAMFGLSLCFTFIALFEYNSFQYAYFSFQGGGLPFACGSLAYHYREKFPRWECGQVLLLSLISLIVWLPILIPALQSVGELYHYLALAAFTYMIPALHHLDEQSRNLPEGEKGHRRYLAVALSRFCGRISYPFFLLHGPVAGYVSRYIIHWVGRSLNLYVTTTMYTLLLSVLIVCVIELPLEFIRRRIRKMALKK